MPSDTPSSIDRRAEYKNIISKFSPKKETPAKSDDLEADQEIRKSWLENNNLESDIKLKKGICFWVKIVVSIYLIFIAGIISCESYNKGLSDSVLIALLTTTTINILGLPLMIIVSLFPNKKQNKEKI